MFSTFHTIKWKGRNNKVVGLPLSLDMTKSEKTFAITTLYLVYVEILLQKELVEKFCINSLESKSGTSLTANVAYTVHHLATLRRKLFYEFFDILFSYNLYCHA